MWPTDGRETNSREKKKERDMEHRGENGCCKMLFTVVVISSLLWDMLCLLLLFWSFEVQRSRARDNCWEDFKLKHSEVGQDGFRKYATAKTALTYRSVILTHVTFRKEFVCAVTLCQ